MSPAAKKQKTKPSKPLILQAVTTASPIGRWTHPDDNSRDFNKLKTWLEFAKTAERGKLNAVFLADQLALYDTYDGPHNFRPAVKTGQFSPRIDPSAIVSAMASVTQSLGFGITFSTIAEHPYHFARRLATLDHVTNGRVAWNIVTSFLKNAARQFNIEFQDHDERYKKSQEYLDVVYKLLLSSWRDDAVVYDKDQGIFADPDLVREINHKGEWFNVPGPAITEPTPQRFPTIFQAGASDAGLLFAAENAELVFVTQADKPGTAEGIAKLRRLASEKFGRDPYSIKVIAGSSFHVGKNHDEALKKLADQKRFFPYEARAVGFSGASTIDLSKYELDDFVDIPLKVNASQTVTKQVLNKPKITKREILENYDRSGGFVGTPEEIADQVEVYLDKYDIDGFNVEIAIYPSDLNDFVDLVVPELQRRGLFWKNYDVPGGTLRQNVFGRDFLNEDHPAYGLRWDPSQSQEEFEGKLAEVEANRVKNRDLARKELGL